MSISNSANNSFKIGPSLELRDIYLIVDIYQNRTTQVDCAAVTAITIEISPPSKDTHPSFDFFPGPTLYSLHSAIKIQARGDFGDETIFLKTLRTYNGSSKQIDSMKPEFNRRHDLAVEISRIVHQNIVYAWRTTRDKGELDQTRILTDRFDELKELTAFTIKPSVQFDDRRFWLFRKLNPFTPQM